MGSEVATERIALLESLLGNILGASWAPFSEGLEASWEAFWKYFGMLCGYSARKSFLHAWKKNFDGF